MIEKKCENCKKCDYCTKTIGIIWGFCNADFEAIDSLKVAESQKVAESL